MCRFACFFKKMKKIENFACIQNARVLEYYFVADFFMEKVSDRFERRDFNEG